MGGGATTLFGSQPLTSARRRAQGIGEKEAEAELLAALRRKNAEARVQRERDAALQREKDLQLALEYAERKKAKNQRLQEERSAVLSANSASLSRSHYSSTSKVISPRRRIQLDDELAEDEEFRELFEKYGDRLRVQMPPPSGSSRNRTQSPRKPAVPSQPKKHQMAPTEATASQVAEVAATAARTSAPHGPRRMSFSGQDVTTASAHHSGGRASASAGHGNSAGRMSGAGAALPPINVSPRHAQNAEDQALADTSSQEEIPEPDRSLMPRKDLLRKKQQALLRKSDVSFYKTQMNAQFQKILDAVELTYNDTTKKRSQASLNLAKPSLEQESRHFSSVAVRQS